MVTYGTDEIIGDDNMDNAISKQTASRFAVEQVDALQTDDSQCGLIHAEETTERGFC